MPVTLALCDLTFLHWLALTCNVTQSRITWEESQEGIVYTVYIGLDYGHVWGGELLKFIDVGKPNPP